MDGDQGREDSANVVDWRIQRKQQEEERGVL